MLNFSKFFIIKIIIFIGIYIFITGKLSMKSSNAKGLILPSLLFLISIYFTVMDKNSMRSGVFGSFFGLLFIVGFIVYIIIKYFNLGE